MKHNAPSIIIGVVSTVNTGDITKVIPAVNTQNVQTGNAAKVKTAEETTKTIITAAKTEKQDQTSKNASKGTPKSLLWQNLSEDDLKKVTQWLNDSMRIFNFRLQFEIQQHPNHIVAKVLDKETGEVIREVPPENLANMLDRMRSEMGLFVDTMI